MDVFNDQRFLLSGPDGNRVERTFRQIITGDDEPLHFSYPQGYMDTASLALCSALAQAAFEPATHDKLIERITTPMSEQDFDQLVNTLRDDFGIDSKVRFMQGEIPLTEAVARPRSFRVLSPLHRENNKSQKTYPEFLNRQHDRWAVRTDQIPLMLFSRATFTEGQGGSGYLAGTSKDMEVRTHLYDRESLRRSIWLNVLSREEQRERFEGYYPLSGDHKAFDSWLWKQKPKERKLSQYRVTLRAGLFWIPARHIVVLGTLNQPATCIMTGEELTAGTLAGVAIEKSSSGIGYGEEAEEGDQKARAFFFHPNAPYKFVVPNKGTPYPRHFIIGEDLSKGEYMKLVEVMGGIFFSGQTKKGEGREEVHVAPAIEQFNSIASGIADYKSRFNSRMQLHCFGFHMLTTQKSVHGGFEAQTYTYPLVGTDDRSPKEAINVAQSIMERAASDAVSILNTLAFAMRICTMTKVDAKKSDEQDGVITITPKPKERLTPNDAFMRDLTIEYWATMEAELQTLLVKINEVGATVDDLTAHRDSLVTDWSRSAARTAGLLFTRIYQDYSRSPAHFISAHKARGAFYGSMKKKGFTFREQSAQAIKETA